MKRLVAALLAGAVLAAASGITPVAAGEKLRIGVEGAYPPFSWKEADGTLKGFDIDVAFALCQRMDREYPLISCIRGFFYFPAILFENFHTMIFKSNTFFVVSLFFT